jgi:hypothetical protein
MYVTARDPPHGPPTVWDRLRDRPRRLSGIRPIRVVPRREQGYGPLQANYRPEESAHHEGTVGGRKIRLQERPHPPQATQPAPQPPKQGEHARRH